jgi:hypothetical protein
MIDEDHIRIRSVCQRLDLVELADTDKEFRVGGPYSCGQLTGDLGTGRERQRTKLTLVFAKRRRIDSHMHEDYALSTLGSIKQSAAPTKTSLYSGARQTHPWGTTESEPTLAHLLVAFVPGRQTNIARWHDRGNSMLVNHLVHTVFQQHNKLIEGIDSPLKLNAVYEINGDGNFLFAQQIQKRILQRLPFSHLRLLLFFIVIAPAQRNKMVSDTILFNHHSQY